MPFVNRDGRSPKPPSDAAKQGRSCTFIRQKKPVTEVVLDRV
jgi:hypothetical protein